MKEKLGIEEDILIERAHHTGKIQKNDILHTYREKKLWKEKIIVNKDFSKETASIHKGLLQKAKDLQSQNKVAKVAHDKLIAYEKERGMIFLKHKTILKLPSS